MAMRIIYVFEMIEVNQNDSEASTVAQMPGVFTGNCLEDDATIGQASQFVVRSAETQFLACGDQSVLQIQDSAAHMETRAKFLCVKWLGQVVVGAGFQTLQEIIFSAARCEQENVG